MRQGTLEVDCIPPHEQMSREAGEGGAPLGFHSTLR